MILFYLLIPPIITAIAVWLFPHKISLRELGLPILAGTIVLLLSSYIGTKLSIRDTEYLSGLVTTVEYFEAWNEKVPCRHTKYCKDSKGNRYACGTDHLYDVDFHPERWVISDTNGFTKETTKAGYDSFTYPSKRVELNRRYHTIDGDKFVKTWGGDRASARLLVTPHSYENKAATLTRWEGEEYVEKINYVGYTPSVVGGPATDFDYLNARYGAAKQLRVLVHILPDLGAAMDLEQRMRGGNKNELVICTSDPITFAYCFSWTDKRDLLSDLSGYLMSRKGEKLDLQGLSGYVEANISRWERKQFSDFSWVIVEPPTWVLVVSSIASALTAIGVSVWTIKAEI